MSGKKNLAQAEARRARVIKVAPVTHAVRLALAATTLALAGTGAAYAGTCSTSGNTTQCTGSFTDTLSYPDAVDLTLVVGDGSTPTSVTPASGYAGVDVSGSGAIAVTNYGGISTYGADGIHAYSSGSLSVTNDGTVYTYVTGAGQEAIDASAHGDVDVTNNGRVVAYDYSAYDVTAVRAQTDGCGCTVTVENTGAASIVAYSNGGNAVGVYAYAADGTAHVGNDGYIEASSNGGLADGVFAAGQDVGVRNGGRIQAVGYSWAAAIEAEGSDVVTVNNDGSLSAYANGYSGHAFGIYAVGGADGATVGNTGSIRAVGPYATGIDASALGNVTVTNSGDIQVGDSYGTAYATGIRAASNGEGGVVQVTNDGLVSANSYFGATGIEVVATGTGASASVSNTGTIYATTSNTSPYSKYGSAVGIVVSADGDAHIDNSGSIYVSQASYGGGLLLAAQGFQPYAGGTAYGAMALSFNGDASVSNSGEIRVVADPLGYAAGILASSQNGNASVDNSGLVQTSAKYSYGIIATSSGGDVNVNNADTGVVMAYSPTYFASALAGIATVGDVTIDNAGAAYAISRTTGVGVLGISSQGGVSESNSGDVVAVGYYGIAVGMFGRADQGVASVDNSGSVRAYSYHGNAMGLLVRGGDAQASNSGDIGAYAYQNAYGIEASGTSAASVHNDGSIVASARYGAALGELATSTTGDVTIDGSGSVAAYGAQLAIGVYGYAAVGTVTINNDGSVYAGSQYGAADGIFAAGPNVAISNTGTSIAQGQTFAAGIEAHGDVVSVDNSGGVQASAANGYAYGIFATGTTSLTLTNSGSVAANGPNAIGLYAGGGDLTVDNSGDVTAAASDYASAIRVRSGSSDGTASVTSSGNLYATGSNVATGIVVVADGAYGSGSIDNSGTVYASSTGKYGVAAGLVVSAYGDASIHNSGSVSTSGGRMGYGVLASTYAGNASISNAGDIQVTTGLFGHGMGLSAESQYGDASIDNSGSVVVASKYAIGAMANSRYGDATVHNAAAGFVGAYSNGPVAVGLAGESYSGHVDVVNDGAVYASAGAQAMGLMAMGEYGDVHIGNTGTVAATSYEGMAFGAFARSTYGDAAIDNAGTIDASSVYGSALGAVASGHTVHVANTGSLQATTGSGSAYGLYVGGYTAAHVVNGGTIAAYADTGRATGVGAYSAGTLDIANSGTISATASDAYGQAIGLSAVGYGAVHVDNSGLITASHPDYAVAVSLDSATVSVLRNTGTIRTDAPVEGQVAVRGGDGVEQVLNYGQLTGALMLHGGDDLLLNGAGGTWTVGNHATDFGDGNDTLAITGGLVDLTDASIAFGAGDDAVVNAAGGTLRLDNGAIYLGDSSTAGNSFTNAGRIQVVGTGNLIDMGTGPAAALVASTNPLALVNNGLIDFVDGAPDDVLTINGDLGGTGTLRIDLRPLTHASDLLYVDGNVASGAVQTVDVDFGGMPTTAMLGTTTTFAHVSGSSAAGSFVGGRVLGWDAGDFVNLQVGVTSQIDASGAVADLFSVGVQAVGLTDPGVLAASMGAGAQSLVNAQVGTWRQRMGVQPENGSIGLSPWLRMFSDAGDVKPGHVASNFGDGGNFDFQQSNSGWELGLNTRPGEHLNLGVLLAKSEGRQHLKDGAGSDHLDGRTFGIYGTWVGDRFYVDASMRWMGFDARMLSAGVQQSGHGEADAFNIEAGYNAWTLGDGLVLQPQVQYTRTRVGSDPIRATLATFDADTANSSRARVGLGVSKAMARGGWTWTPYGSLNVVHEFDGEFAYRVNNDFSGSTSTKGTSALVELGMGARKDKLSVTGGVNWTDGGAINSVFGGQLVVRYNW